MKSTLATTWETPFTYARFPSVALVMEPDGEGTALLVVAPGGLDAYPKYIVRFARVLAVICAEEAGSILELGQVHSPNEVFAHIWDASPHAAAYANTALGANLEIRHYVVFGGDNIASVVCGSAPVIETVSAPMELAVRYAV